MVATLKRDAASAPAENRFYDGLCDPYPHEPTKDRLAVVQCETRGEGVISLGPIEGGTIVFKFHGAILKEQTLFTLQLAPGVYIEDPVVMGKILHSCDPNMVCDVPSKTFTAVRPIAVGEFLTMDYETTEDELFRSFDCHCGSPRCRGSIKGRARQKI